MGGKSDRAAEARSRIVNFHNLYVQYIEARQADKYEEAERRRMEMADVSLGVQRDLEKVDQGLIILQDAPALGGRHYGSRLVDVLLTNQADKFNIDPGMIQVMLRQAAGEYEALADQPGSEFGDLVGGLLRGFSFILLLPIRVGEVVLVQVRRRYVALAVILGALASVLTILQFFGRLF